MPNHPNRSRAEIPARNPTSEEVRAAREAAGLTQTAAAELIHCALRGWQEWEAGNRKMHPAFWELFRIKLGR
ncbi:MAG: helix-turn-helix transcriptional regulator [Nevskia sp.]|jgi:DNA-binding transcriptional regulator YiaG|nr:helix-turn-helix transcriptional regulator [Nevskia sp.]